MLDAAAECQSGRYIVCPADLIERLRRQHARIAQGPEGVDRQGLTSAPMDWLSSFLRLAWSITLESAPWVVFSLLIGGLIHEFLPTSRLFGALNRKVHGQCSVRSRWERCFRSAAVASFRSPSACTAPGCASGR